MYSIHICYLVYAHPEDKLTIMFFTSHVDLLPAVSHPQYTSKSSALNIPCTFSSQVSWAQIKAKGILGGHWDFIPKQGSSLSSGKPQRLFSLSLEDPVTWKPEQGRGLTSMSNFKTGDLSLTRRQGKADDSGEYVCTLQFTNGITLSRTVQVEFLQGKSEQIAWFI